MTRDTQDCASGGGSSHSRIRRILIAIPDSLYLNNGMKRMKAVVECEFEFPDDYSIAPDHDGVPNLKIGEKIFVPSILWMEQTVFLEGLIPGKYETEPSRGFKPADKRTNNKSLNFLTVEDGHVELIEDKLDGR